MIICPICKKNEMFNTNKIFETKKFFVTHGPIESQILGYIYIEPKRHIENWTEFSVTELTEITTLIKEIEVMLKKLLNAERVYTVTISEDVRHLHFHIIPRVFGQELKGLCLIKQATQQISICGAKITEDQLGQFINDAKVFFEMRKIE